MLSRLKVNGFHTGVGGVGVPKEFYSELDAADIPFMAIAADSDPYDALQVVRARADAGKPEIHTVIYRRSLRLPDGQYDGNVPDYSKTPYEAAVQHWSYHKALFPALVRDNKDLIWVITSNEPNKDSDTAVEWLAEFSTHTAQMAIRDGYRWAAFGWSGGTPEPRHWRGPKMLEFLRLAAANRGRVAIALHEYSWTVDDIWNGRNGDDYGLVGRFTQLLTACNEQGVSHPDIFITEWGWSEHDTPAPEIAMQHIREVGELYARYTAVKGAAVWYLGSGFQDIYRKAQQLIAPLKDLLMTTAYEVDEPQPPEPPPAKHRAIVVKLPQDVSAIEWLAASDTAYGYRHTMTASHDDMLTILRGGNDESYVKASHPERDTEALALVEAAGYRWEPLYNEPEPPPNPFAGLEFGQPLDTSWETVRGGEFNARRDYSRFPGGKVNDKHEGIDAAPNAGIPARVLNLWSGTVAAINYSAGYGNNVTIRHSYNGVIFTTRRAHLASINVSVGQPLAKGAVIGICGSTGNSTGNHDHLTMQSPGYGMSGYIVPDVVDPTPYYPEPAIFPPPPSGESLNIRAYFEPAGDIGPMKVLAWLDGSKTQPQQLLRRDGSIIEAKGEGEWVDGKRYDHYERYTFANGEMRRWEDTSAGNLEAYTQHGNRWLPEVIVIGRQYINQPRVTKYSLVDCRLISDSITTDYLTVTARHEQWPAANGIVIDDVIEVEWRKSAAGKVEEKYFYGRGLGLVGWGVGSLEAAVSELPEGRAPLNPVLWGCG